MEYITLSTLRLQLSGSRPNTYFIIRITLLQEIDSMLSKKFVLSMIVLGIMSSSAVADSVVEGEHSMSQYHRPLPYVI